MAEAAAEAIPLIVVCEDEGEVDAPEGEIDGGGDDCVVALTCVAGLGWGDGLCAFPTALLYETGL